MLLHYLYNVNNITSPPLPHGLNMLQFVTICSTFISIQILIHQSSLSSSQKYLPVNNQDEVGKIIIYTTSMRVVRETFDDCQFVRKLFHNHRVRFEERDLFMNIEFQRELQERLGDDQPITLPIVFIDGELIGVCMQRLMFYFAVVCSVTRVNI